MTGCCSVKTSGSGPIGLWKSWRIAVASEVSGLNSAIWRSPSGRPATGTKIPLRNIAGKITDITIPSAPSGSRTIRPTQTPAQVTAKAMNSSSAKAPTVSKTLPSRRPADDQAAERDDEQAAAQLDQLRHGAARRSPSRARSAAS